MKTPSLICLWWVPQSNGSATLNRSFNATAYNDILDNSVHPTCCFNIAIPLRGPWRNVFQKFGEEQLDCLTQSPDLNPIQRLWEELKWAGPYCPTSLLWLSERTISAVRRRNLVRSFHRRVKKYSTITYGCNLGCPFIFGHIVHLNISERSCVSCVFVNCQQATARNLKKLPITQCPVVVWKHFVLKWSELFPWVVVILM